MEMELASRNPKKIQNFVLFPLLFQLQSVHTLLID